MGKKKITKTKRKSPVKRGKKKKSFWDGYKLSFFVLSILLSIALFYLKNHAAEPAQIVYDNNFEEWTLPEPTLDGYSEQIISRKGYTVSYNSDYRNPNWVAYVLERDELNAPKIKRSDKFVKDPAVNLSQGGNEDYRRSGYDRGHLAPAADMSWSQKTMSESFYFSNMSPQKPAFNRGIWKELEEQVRKWADRESLLLVATGPVLEKDLKRIGPNQVAIPKYFYKVIIDPVGSEKKGIGFVISNEAGNKSLQSYAVTIDSVERLTGINFFEAMPDQLEETLEEQLDLRAWKW
ncbi:MAG: DNA/RNA non-specific endonuclease [Bacteroidales bacterium]